MFTLVLWLAAIALTFYILSNLADIIAMALTLLAYVLLPVLAIAVVLGFLCLLAR